jgi:glycosidase
VEAERDDPSSMLSLCRALIELRRSEPALALGAYAPLTAAGSVLAYARREDGLEFLIALNLGPEPARLQLPAAASGYEVVLTTLAAGGRPPQGGVLELRGDEGVILRAT